MSMLQKRLLRQLGRAIADFRLIEPCDRILVGVPREKGERRSTGGILIPSTAQVATRLMWAEALAVGNHVRTVEVGDRVLFSPEDRQEVEVHGEVYRTEFESSFSADWRGTRFSEGAWVIWPGQVSGGGAAFDRLKRPEGRVYFAGDHLSYAIGWQHGAFESARQVVMDLHKRVLAST